MEKLMKMLGTLGESVKEENGQGSGIRVILYLIVGYIVFNGTYAHITTGVLPELDWRQIALVVSALGGKIIQKDKETKVAKENKDLTPPEIKE